MANGWSKFKRLFWQPGEEANEAETIELGRAPDGLSEALQALRDVQGVVGSIVVDLAGRVRASDLPRLFDEYTVRLLAARMIDLKLGLGAASEQPLSGTLDFQDYSFHVKSFASGLIGVLLEESAQTPALGMALNLVSRRVAAELAEPQLQEGGP